MDTEKKTIGQFLKGYMKKSLDVFHHPIRLLPTVLIGVIWLVLGYMASKAELILPLKVVSFLTFAQGGLYGGFLGAAGGIVGKVVVAAFVNSLLMPLFDSRLPFQGIGKSFSNMFSSMSLGSAKGLAPLLKGTGFALLLYGLMNLTQNGHNSMVGIVAAVMLLQGIGNQGGFMFGLLFAAAGSISKGRTPSYVTVTRTLTGMTIGFSIGVALSVIGFPFSLLLAIPVLLLGFVLGLFVKNNQQQPLVATQQQNPPYHPSQQPQQWQQSGGYPQQPMQGNQYPPYQR
jgi:hypothetical protein